MYRSCNIEPPGTWYGGTLACMEGETIFIQGQKHFAVILKYSFQNVFNMTGTVLISNQLDILGLHNMGHVLPQARNMPQGSK